MLKIHFKRRLSLYRPKTSTQEWGQPHNENPKGDRTGMGERQTGMGGETGCWRGRVVRAVSTWAGLCWFHISPSAASAVPPSSWCPSSGKPGNNKQHGVSLSSSRRQRSRGGCRQGGGPSDNMICCVLCGIHNPTEVCKRTRIGVFGTFLYRLS